VLSTKAICKGRSHRSDLCGMATFICSTGVNSQARLRPWRMIRTRMLPQFYGGITCDAGRYCVHSGRWHRASLGGSVCYRVPEEYRNRQRRNRAATTWRFYSCKTTVNRDLLILIFPLYSMKPSFLNLFMKKFTRDRVVPIMLARVSWETFGSTRTG
jgi:hypothetical protein